MPILGPFIFLCTDWLTHWLPVYIGWLITRICPFQINNLDLGYMPNSYSVYAAYQSPLGDWIYPFSFGYKLRVSSEITQGLF